MTGKKEDFSKFSIKLDPESSKNVTVAAGQEIVQHYTTTSKPAREKETTPSSEEASDSDDENQKVVKVNVPPGSKGVVIGEGNTIIRK